MSHPKHARADHEILEVIGRRYSPRAFDATRPVARGDLLRLFEAARWAPSSRNEQPWRFVVADRYVSADAFAALAASLGGRNPTWASAAPVLALLAVRTTHERDGSRNRFALYDAGQAVGFLTLQATAMGLGVRQMEGFDQETARLAVGVPEPFVPAVVMAIGYPGAAESLAHEPHREDERRPRVRRPLSATVYEGSWGTPIGG